MSYLPPSLLPSEPPDGEAEFWAHCNARRLMFQSCPHCGHAVHPPLPVCPRCQSLERAWVEAPARAVVFSFTWAHSAAHPDVRDALPYNVVLLEFPDLPGVRLVSNVVDTSPGDLGIGDPVELAWDEAGAQWLPRFRKR